MNKKILSTTTNQYSKTKHQKMIQRDANKVQKGL